MKITQIAVFNNGKGSINNRSNVITLQRQGCSKTVNAGCDLFFIEICENVTNSLYRWTLYYGSRKACGFVLSGQSFKSGSSKSFESAKIDVLDVLNNQMSKLWHANYTYSFSDMIQAYMFNFGITYDYCNDDKIISPFYCDGFGILNINHEVIATWDGLKNGNFEILSENLDEAESLAEGFKKGFHDCDYKKGPDHCVKRLAWLSGEYMRSRTVESKGEIRCLILNNEMGLLI